MFQSLLTRRYLVSKVMPLLAAVAVALCTAMVLIVWSVMGGFLTLLISSGRTLIGDVEISWPVVGIPHYERLMGDLQADPMIEAVSPTIETFGLLGLATGERRTVRVVGIEPASYHAVTGYRDQLWWQPLVEGLEGDTGGRDLRNTHQPEMAFYLEEGSRLLEKDPETDELRPAVVVGTQVSRWNIRDPAGFLVPLNNDFFLPDREVSLTVLPLSQAGVAINVQSRKLPVANEFTTGMYEVDANYVLMPLDVLQPLLNMHAGRRVSQGGSGGGVRVAVDPVTGEESFVVEASGEEPARVTNILVRAVEGVTPAELEARVEEIYFGFAREFEDAPPPSLAANWIYVWRDKPGLSSFIKAVEKEIGLILLLFLIVSLTAVFLVFAIFWSMISEKTRDIGILRAVGASTLGIIGLFLRYGLAIGVVGSVCGLALAIVIVDNINPIHEWLGRALGIVVWDPATYYFTEIPARVVPWQALAVAAGGMCSALLGALIPAIRAATMDPVRALRFE
ncbi:MAG: FtsX-like permease family protein [Planctomycetota bacterium]